MGNAEYTNLRAGSSSDRERENLRRVLVAIQFELRKRSCMSLNRLANTALFAVQLHRTLDLKRGRICRVSCNTNKDHPLLVARDTVVNDLSSSQCGMAIEHLLRR